MNFVKKGDKKYAAGVHAKLYVLRNDTVIYKNAYSLETMPLEDTAKPATILDIKRFELPNGLYDLVLMIEDQQDSFSNAQVDIPIQVSVSKEHIQMADLLFCDTLYAVTQPDAFTRYGYNFIPSVSNIFPQESKSILFYTEIYNVIPTLGKGNFTYKVSVKNAFGVPVKGFEKTRSLKATNLNYFFDALDISKLPGGEYYLQVEVLDKENKPVARREKYFIRLTESFILASNQSNSLFAGLTTQNIKEFVPYLEPVATTTEIENFSKASGKDSLAVQEWFSDFWKSRNPEDPEKAYADYVKAVTEVQQNYSTMLSQGFRTDRGRIYLKYGKPDYVAPYIDEPNAYPYEIWHYYKTSRRNNVKFIFYNPTQIDNDYILL
ncbi:MAG: GWxTD domain-containing protein, partial [Bacteroidia bacterium]